MRLQVASTAATPGSVTGHVNANDKDYEIRDLRVELIVPKNGAWHAVILFCIPFDERAVTLLLLLPLLIILLFSIFICRVKSLVYLFKTEPREILI